MTFDTGGPADAHVRLAAQTGAQRRQALARWQFLRPHLEDGVPLVRVAGEHGVPERTLRRWLAGYRAGGLAGLVRRAVRIRAAAGCAASCSY